MPAQCTRFDRCKHVSVPGISVVMSVHNCERYVAEAIQSILVQTRGDFEFIILDDGSTDRCWEIITEYASLDNRIRALRRAHAGLTTRLNQGLQLARGKYVARMDADDVSLPERFERQTAHLGDHPECVVLGTHVERIDSEGLPIDTVIYPLSHEAIDRALLGRPKDGPTIAHPSVMMRRQAVLAAGGYRAEFVAAQDRDLWLRMAERGKLANLPRPLVKYRCHLGSVTSERLAVQRECSLLAIRQAHLRRGMEFPESACATFRPLMGNDHIRQTWVRRSISAKNFATARKHALAGVMANPGSITCWRLLARSLLGETGESIQAWRRRRARHGPR